MPTPYSRYVPNYPRLFSKSENPRFKNDPRYIFPEEADQYKPREGRFPLEGNVAKTFTGKDIVAALRDKTGITKKLHEQQQAEHEREHYKRNKAHYEHRAMRNIKDSVLLANGLIQTEEGLFDVKSRKIVTENSSPLLKSIMSARTPEALKKYVSPDAYKKIRESVSYDNPIAKELFKEEPHQDIKESDQYRNIENVFKDENKRPSLEKAQQVAESKRSSIKAKIASPDKRAESMRAYEKRKLEEQRGIPHVPKQTHQAKVPKMDEDLLKDLNNPEFRSTNAQQTFGSKWAESAHKAAVKDQILEMNEGYKPYEGERIAQRSPMEEAAQELLVENSPFSSPEYLGRKKDINNRIERLSDLEKPSEAAHSYLNEARKNPFRIFKDEFEKEREERSKLHKQESDEEFYNRIVPLLQRTNMVAPAKYGSVSKAIERAYKHHEKNKNRYDVDLTHAVNESRRKAGENYVQHQANLGQQAASHVNREHENEMKATSMLAQHHHLDQEARDRHIENNFRHGGVDRSIQQQQFDESFNEKNRADEFGPKQRMLVSMLASRHPVSPTGYSTRSGIVPPSARPNISQQFGAGLMNMGAGHFDQINQGYKKGGQVKKKKADGGLIQEAVQNAVIDKGDPLYELRKLINREAMAEPIKLNKRRRYQTGGIINPIAAGAEQARDFKARDRLNSHLENMQRPEQQSTASRMLRDFMTGVASVGGDNTLGYAAKAFKESDENRRAHKSQNEQRHLSSLMKQYEIENEARNEERARRKEERDEKYKNRQLSLAEKKLAQDYELGTMKQERSSAKLDKTDQEILSDASKHISGGGHLVKMLSRMRELAGKIKTGEMTSGMDTAGKPYWQAKLGHGKQADLDEFDKISREFANTAATALGQRAGAKVIELFQKAKPNREMDQKAIYNIIDETIANIEDEKKRAHYINEQLKAGVSPKEALAEYEKKKQPHGPGETVKPTIEDMFKNDPSLQKLEAEYAALG